MYIEDRLFSENTEETLYSILLDEDEYALYSEFQKEFGNKLNKALKNDKLILDYIKGIKNPSTLRSFLKSPKEDQIWEARQAANRFDASKKISTSDYLIDANFQEKISPTRGLPNGSYGKAKNPGSPIDKMLKEIFKAVKEQLKENKRKGIKAINPGEFQESITRMLE